MSGGHYIILQVLKKSCRRRCEGEFWNSSVSVWDVWCVWYRPCNVWLIQ